MINLLLMSSYLQMNSVPRADSPRTMPLRTPLEDSRMQYTTPMLMNEAANVDHSYFPNSTLVRWSIMMMVNNDDSQ